MVTNAIPLPLGASALIRYAFMSEDQPPSVIDIAGLTARMARGEEEAFRSFQEAYFPRLLRYLFAMTRGNEDAARESLQLTALRVARHVRRFDSEAVFWSWLTVLARSAVVDEARRRKRQTSLLRRFLQWQQIDNQPAQPELDTHLFVLLERSLSDLPAEERELLERKYYHGESVREIAGSLNVTEQAVDSRLVRARRRLKELLVAFLKDEASREN
jgi:RNA polymerase sigma-70 factor (ECF subfamily)